MIDESRHLNLYLIMLLNSFQDTAQVYKNEADIGKCFETLLPKYGLKREDTFITTKIGFLNMLIFRISLYDYL